MNISIINKSRSKLEEIEQSRLVWVAALIAENCCFCSGLTAMIHTYISWEKLTEPERYVWTRTMMELNPKINDEYIQQYTILYERVKESRRMKQKGRDHIIMLKKSEKIIMSLFDSTKVWLESIITGNNYHQLMPIMELNPVNGKKPLLIYSIDEEFTKEQSEQIIQTMAGMVYQPGIIAFVDSTIHKYEKGRDMNKSGMMLTTPTFIYDFLFEIIAPETLTSSQVNVIRYQLSKSFWSYFDKLVILSIELKDIAFTKDNFKILTDLYHQKTNELKPSLQEAIDSNEILNQLKTEGVITAKYKVFIGITSFNILLNYYNKAEVLNNDIIQYTKEEIEKEISADNARLFLFMEK